MNWMDKLERKIGRFAIPHITRWLLIANLVGYLVNIIARVNPVVKVIWSFIDFSAADILHGQIWRLVTWIFVPTISTSIWSILFLICLLMMGENMENMLGTFKMNVYFVQGILLSDIVGIIAWLVLKAPINLSLYYILFSLYLMLGLFMPDATVRLYFVLPIRMKWLMIIYVAGMAFEIFSYVRYGMAIGSPYGKGFIMGLMFAVMYGTQIICALANLGLFVFFCKRRVSLKHRKRQRQFRADYNAGVNAGYQSQGAQRGPFSQPRPGSGISKHKCVICGRTELTNPEMQFRYCSKCVGNREYCEEHLFAHTHVR